MADSFGNRYRLTDWGDTHGDYLEGCIEGCPAGIVVDEAFLAYEMLRRAPSAEVQSTQRRESDTVEFLTGLDKQHRTTGEPLRFRIANQDAHPNEENRHVIRPSHSSYTYFKKYGHTDNEKCGRSSARQTACRVVAGAIAKIFLHDKGVRFEAKTISTGAPQCYGDSVGALVKGRILGLPAGLGEPVYDKFSARLAYAMLSINAAKGFEIGFGFKAANSCGSQYNDKQRSDFTFCTNHDGGVQAGITNGEEVFFTVAFKPIPSVRFDQESIDFEGQPAICHGSNRNDLCVSPRVIPVVEAMAAIVVMDFWLAQFNPDNNQTNTTKQ